MIQDYVQYNPSKIIFGKGAENNVAEEIKAHGGSRVLIHFDAGISSSRSSKRSIDSSKKPDWPYSNWEESYRIRRYP